MDPAVLESCDLLDPFAEAVRQHPRRPAIVHNRHHLTYAQLEALVRSTARAIGPQPGAVGVLTARAPGTVVVLLAVLASGGTYCPIDPSFPAHRQRAMLAAAGCRLVVNAVDLEVAAGSAPMPVAAAEAPAYLLFTSGSTGEPRPVVTPRRAIETTVAALRDLFGVSPADRVLQFASLNWDTSFEEILPTLTAGAALIFDDEAYTGSFRRFLRAVDEQAITVLDLPTAFWHELVRHLASEGTTLPSSLRLMVIGGEAASPARLADWHRLNRTGVRLMNTYGCTETTLITHAVDLDPGDHDRVPIGRALAHVQERISDEGELLIGGPAIALGYLDQPEATRRRFVEFDDGTYFRTGDRVSRAPDGLLVHEGRLDHTVKIRGVRVDPGEVESHLVAHPLVAAAAVTGVTVAGRTVLVGYVVADGAADLLAWLRTRVPAHLVPSKITVVDELVRTASGKTDRLGTHRRYTSKEASR